MRQASPLPGTSRFEHEAVFYRGPDDLGPATVPFIREGLERGESVLVVLLPDRIRSLRSSLGPDAGRVAFVDMNEVGANPARIIPVWRRFVHDSARGRPARGIGEPVWSGRRDVELEECRLHESLLNLAFDDGPAWRLLCPYDADALPPAVVEDAVRTHPSVSPAEAPDVGYGGHPLALLGFATPLPDAPESAVAVPFEARDLVGLRSVLGRWSRGGGLSDDRARHLVLAAHELATNSVVHGGGGGVLRTWAEPGALIVEISDAGRIADPLVGRELVLDVAEGGRGVWIAHQLCDLVQLRSHGAGTAARLHFWL